MSRLANSFSGSSSDVAESNVVVPVPDVVSESLSRDSSIVIDQLTMERDLKWSSSSDGGGGETEKRTKDVGVSCSLFALHFPLRFNSQKYFTINVN